MASVGKEVKKLLNEYESLSLDTDTGKIKCSLSGHEMPNNAAAIKTYIGGKKFKKLSQGKYLEQHKHKDFLVASNKPNRKHQLFCQLTLRHLNNEPTHIEKHIQGRRFQKAFARWQECQKKGEKFKPLGGNRQKHERDERRNNSDTNADSDASDAETDDSMTDLWPAEEEDGSGSDFDFGDVGGANGEESPAKDTDDAPKQSTSTGDATGNSSKLKRKKNKKAGSVPPNKKTKNR